MNRVLVLFLFIVVVKAEAQPSVLSFADSLFAYGNYTKAIEHYKLINNNKVNYKIAKAYQAIGNYDKALNSLKEAVNQNPNNTLYIYEYAKLLSSTKDYINAEVKFIDLIKVDSLNPNYYYELGLIKEQLKDSTKLDYYSKAFQLDKTHQKAIFKIAKHYLIKRKYDTVNYLVDTGLKSYANNKKLISLKAQNYYWKEDYDNALIWFKKLIDLNESTEFIHEKLSFCYAQTYDFQKAIEHQEKAIIFSPNNPTNLYILGQLFQKLNYFDKAEEYISKAIAILDEPLDKEYVRYGTILNRQKKYKQAIEVFKKALEENPKNEGAAFYIVIAKEQYYADKDAIIKAYEEFLKSSSKNTYAKMAEYRLSELKKEQFMAADSTAVIHKKD